MKHCLSVNGMQELETVVSLYSYVGRKNMAYEIIHLSLVCVLLALTQSIQMLQ
jgi:hypothetical protein